MSGSKGARPLPLSAEVPLAFAAGLVSFAAVAVTLAAPDSSVLAVLIAVAALFGVVEFVRHVGVTYAASVAVATLLAFDWFRLPPTHTHQFPPGRDLLDLAAYLGVAVFVGAVATRAGRRVEATEMERSELADEQAALRRVATLVSGRVESAEILTAVAREVGLLLDVDATHVGRYEPDGTVIGVGSWSLSGDHIPAGRRLAVSGDNVTALVKQTGRPARMDSYSEASGEVADLVKATGLSSSVGAPIVVDGRLWGVMIASSKREQPLPPDTEARVGGFTDLVASAISNTEAWSAAQALSDEQAALRRVATLVAQGIPSSELFGVVAREVGALLGADFAGMARFEGDEVITVGVWAADGEHPPVPPRWQMEPGDPATTVAQRRDAVRWDDWTDVPGPIAAFVREELRVHCSVGTPIVVEGRLWGALAIHSKQSGSLPRYTEARMAQFTDLVATAIANQEARREVESLAEEQAMLRRVATLVAQDVPREEVFTAIAEGIGQVLGTEASAMLRYLDDHSAVVEASLGAAHDRMPPGYVLSLERDSATARVFRTGEPARIDDYQSMPGEAADLARATAIRSVVAAPILVGGRLWGAMTGGTSGEEGLPADTESRLAQFTELMGTAIANSEARREVERLAEEQAALGRVATLVAQGGEPSELFLAVTQEVARLLYDVSPDLEPSIIRFDPGPEFVLVGTAKPMLELPIGSRWGPKDLYVSTRVLRSGQSARVEEADVAAAAGADAELLRRQGFLHQVGSPILVEGRMWGAMTINSGVPLPLDAGERLEKFTDLVATAIANTDSRDQLAASRARLVTAGDEARRRVVRDLHDGAQQRLVHTVVTLKLAQRALRDDNGDPDALVAEALEHAKRGNVELRELAHGILPPVLTHGGLRAGIDSVVARVDLPVNVDVPTQRFPAEIEASAYFIVAEALTNVVKHAKATSAAVTASASDGTLCVEVRDDGTGGADREGRGLVGMADRVTALGGRLTIESPAAGGTRLLATLPIE